MRARAMAGVRPGNGGAEILATHPVRAHDRRPPGTKPADLLKTMADAAPTQGSPLARRVLVVDDEPTARRSLAWLLRDAGYEVLTAPGGAEALATLDQARVDVLLTDLRMPGVDGLDLLRRGRILDPDLTVVMMTAHGDVTDAVRAMSEGAFWYVRKPLDLDQLLDVLHRAILLRSLREESAAARTDDAAAVRAAHEVTPEVAPRATLDQVEREAILRTMRAARGELSAAARALGVGVPFLTERLRRYGSPP
jgi:two-component system NtrC family response regulator